MSVGEYVFSQNLQNERSKQLVSPSHEARFSSIDVNTYLSSILVGIRSKPYVIVPEACVTELLNITVPVALDSPKLMIPLSVGTISVFFFISKMSRHKYNTGSLWRFLFCCFGQRNGYQRVPTESCSGSEDEVVSVSSRVKQERDEKMEAQRQLQNQKEINKELEIRISDREERITQQIQDIECMRTRLNEEEKEKQELLTRLSEHISLKLADNNPNIADLSDLNRPTKLAEKFSLLYDDQWTDAFDALQQRPEFKEESKVIKQLLDFLLNKAGSVTGSGYSSDNIDENHMHTDMSTCNIEESQQKHRLATACFQFCREQADSQMRTMMSINNITVPPESVSTEMKKLMKETRKKCASAYVPVLYQIVIDLLGQDCEELIKTENVQIYIKRCTELCWLMSVQDPPMALSAKAEEGSAYNKTEYREYTQSGPVVHYVVWPAVLIQDNGDLIAKGIVQCREKVDVGNFVCDTEAMSEQNILTSERDGEIDYHNDFAEISDNKTDKADVALEDTKAPGERYTLDIGNNEDREITQCPYTEADAIMDTQKETEDKTHTLQGPEHKVNGPVAPIQVNSNLTLEETKAPGERYTLDIGNNEDRERTQCPYTEAEARMDTKTETEDNTYTLQESETKEKGPDAPMQVIGNFTSKETVGYLDKLPETKLKQCVEREATGEIKNVKTDKIVEFLTKSEDNKDEFKESASQEKWAGEPNDSSVLSKETVPLHTDISETKVTQEVNADASCEGKDVQDAAIMSSQDKETVISDGADHHKYALFDTDCCTLSETSGEEAKTYASEVTEYAETVRTQHAGKETLLLEEPN